MKSFFSVSIGPVRAQVPLNAQGGVRRSLTLKLPFTWFCRGEHQYSYWTTRFGMALDTRVEYGGADGSFFIEIVVLGFGFLYSKQAP